MIALLTCDRAQIGQRARDAPIVASAAKRTQGLLVEVASGGDIALLARDISLLIHGPGSTATVTVSKLLEDLGRLF